MVAKIMDKIKVKTIVNKVRLLPISRYKINSGNTYYIKDNKNSKCCLSAVFYNHIRHLGERKRTVNTLLYADSLFEKYHL